MYDFSIDVCFPVWGYVHMHVGAHGGQERALKLQILVRCQMRVLGTKHGAGKCS